MEATYAKKLEYAADIKSKRYEMKMEDYIVCSHNGIGQIFSDGGCAGVWAYILQNPDIEGVQVKCQGRGDKICDVLCMPSAELKKMKLKPFQERKLENLELEQGYQSINEIRAATFSSYSFKSLIDSGFFAFSHGVAEHNKMRYFGLEASYIYMLEEELKKINGAEKVIFDTAFDFGKNVAEKDKTDNAKKFVADFMSALGWGDTMITKKHGKYIIISNYYPWTMFSKDSNFIVYSGIISGLFSGFLDKKIVFKPASKDLTSGYFSLTMIQK
jgi:predicted hydrocarbon binding protein